MKPGTSASIWILYEPHADKGSGFNPQSKLTSFNIPTAISAISGVPSGNVSFSKGTLLFSQNNWTIYDYTVSASANSSGYFVIIVPFGPTLYPALAVSSEANSLNTSTLSLWGYVGGITTGETAIPSIIVGTSNLTIVNVTITGITAMHDSRVQRNCLQSVLRRVKVIRLAVGTGLSLVQPFLSLSQNIVVEN